MSGSSIPLWTALIWGGPLTTLVVVVSITTPILVLWKRRTGRWHGSILSSMTLLPIGVSFIQVFPLIRVVEEIIIEQPGMDMYFPALVSIAQARAVLYLGGASALVTLAASVTPPRRLSLPKA